MPLASVISSLRRAIEEPRADSLSASPLKEINGLAWPYRARRNYDESGYGRLTGSGWAEMTINAGSCFVSNGRLYPTMSNQWLLPGLRQRGRGQKEVFVGVFDLFYSGDRYSVLLAAMATDCSYWLPAHAPLHLVPSIIVASINCSIFIERQLRASLTRSSLPE